MTGLCCSPHHGWHIKQDITTRFAAVYFLETCQLSAHARVMWKVFADANLRQQCYGNMCNMDGTVDFHWLYNQFPIEQINLAHRKTYICIAHGCCYLGDESLYLQGNCGNLGPGKNLSACYPENRLSLYTCVQSFHEKANRNPFSISMASLSDTDNEITTWRKCAAYSVINILLTQWPVMASHALWWHSVSCVTARHLRTVSRMLQTTFPIRFLEAPVVDLCWSSLQASLPCPWRQFPVKKWHLWELEIL